MSSQITTAFVQQYNSNVYHLSQQKGSKLRPGVRTEAQKGKSAFYDRIGSVSVIERTSRHGDTPQIDTPHSRRMVTLKDYEWADLIDDQDKIRTLIDPTNPYALSASWAFGRKMDDVILDAALGTAYSGESGGTSVSFTDGQRVAAVSGSAHVNLNVQALRKASYLLNKANVDPMAKRFCALNASALESLLQATEVTSSDYNTVKALVQGEIDTFLGFKFILTEEVDDYSAGSKNFNATTGLYDSGGALAVSSGKSIVCWAEGGIILAVGMEPQAKISERADKGYATQVYNRMSIGATRMEEEKVVEIICSQ